MKRIVTFLLALVMVWAMLPAAALSAHATEAEEPAAVEMFPEEAPVPTEPTEHILQTAAAVRSAGSESACGENVIWDLTDGVLTISGTGPMYDYTAAMDSPWYAERASIRSLVIEKGVTAIGEHAFYNCSSLTDVSIGDTVTAVGGYAFRNCTSLTSVELPDSITMIGSGAFNGCSALKTMTIPFVGETANPGSDTYRYPLGHIFGFLNTAGSTATKQFYGSSTGYTTSSTYYVPTSLASVTVTGGEIWYGAFYNCTGLTHIGIPENVTGIDDSAFYGCSNLKDIVIPESVVRIGSAAFSNCSSLPSLTIPAGVTTIGSAAFSNCSSLSAVNIPNGVTKIVDWMFSGCSSLSGITLHDGVTAIGKYAFDGCANLKSIVIPQSVTAIGEAAFSDCRSLTGIEIPDSVTEIGADALSGCSGLQSVTIPFVGESAKPGADADQYPFGYFFGSAGYEGGVATKQYYYNSTGSLAVSTYYLPASLQSVTVTGGQILFGAFYNCSGLTSIAIPKTVTEIGGSAFCGCSGLTSIEIPEKVTKIGASAFSACSSLESAVLPMGVKTIDTAAFLACSSLSDIAIPDSVTTIGDWAFSECSSLTGVNIPASVTAIGASAFRDSSNIRRVVFAGNAPKIGNEAFSGVIATAYYCAGNTTWTADVKQNYGGVITWATQYGVLEGDGALVILESDPTLTVKVDGEDAVLVSITLDGEIVDPACYTASEGNTVFVFQADYLKTLEDGTHSLVLSFTDGVATAKFTVRKTARLLGDVTGDDKVTATDYSRLLAHVKKVNLITDAGSLWAADVTGDGKITATDYSRLLAHVKKVNPLW